MSIYDFKVQTPSGEEHPMSAYKDHVLLIVNTASGCGFALQLAGLEILYERFKDEKFEVLAFPCSQFLNQEPLSDTHIADHCQLTYGTTFPFFKKVNVKGHDAHPLFRHLVKEAPGLLTKEIKWNFTKFLISRDGHVVRRFAPAVKPEKLIKPIQQLL